jgi:two-component system chemotaxis response regulator CheB
MRKIRVLIVDDSMLVREILNKGISSDPNLEVIGMASDVFVAREFIVDNKPDVITLDVEMPKMNGIEFLKRLMPQMPIPVIMVSSLTQKGTSTTIEALENGAVDFIGKPSGDSKELANMIGELITKIKIASTVNVAHWKFRTYNNVVNSKQLQKQNLNYKYNYSAIAIGASTGGTEAIKDVLENLTPNLPPIVITQHMPKGFTKTFANRLNEISLLTVKEAEEGDTLSNGHVYIAPGDYHMTFKKIDDKVVIRLNQEERINGHRPSCDPMFMSISNIYKEKTFGVILTGMGSDGGIGLKQIRDNGGYTLGQNEESSVVYGMPKVAYDLGGVVVQSDLRNISKIITTRIKQL